MTPNIGDRGKFIIDLPFMDENFFNAEVEVVSIETLSSIIEKGKEPYSEFYEPKNISLCDYKCDIKTKFNIVTFKNKEDEYREVPDIYIKSIPFSAGIEYVPVTVIIQLPPMWVDISYDNLIGSFSDISARVIGVRPISTEVIVTGSAEYIDPIEHEMRNIERKNKTDDITQNVYGQVDYLLNQNKMLLEKVKLLEKAVKGVITTKNKPDDLFDSLVDAYKYD